MTDGAAERYMAMNSHVDKKNHGPSYIGVLGDYTGGKLWIYDENGSASHCTWFARITVHDHHLCLLVRMDLGHHLFARL